MILPFPKLFLGRCWSPDPSLDVSRSCGFKVGEALALWLITALPSPLHSIPL